MDIKDIPLSELYRLYYQKDTNVRRMQDILHQELAEQAAIAQEIQRREQEQTDGPEKE